MQFRNQSTELQTFLSLSLDRKDNLSRT